MPSYSVQIANRTHKVYLTIDDHPNKRTNQVLNILKRCKLKATFFVVGYAETQYLINPRYGPTRRLHLALIRIHQEGHTVGNHGVTHRNMCRISQRGYKWELATTQRLVSKITQYSLKYWRPPFLHHCQRVRKYAGSLGLTMVLADVEDIGKSASYMWRQVKIRSRKFLSSIVLFHKHLRKLKNFLVLSGLCQAP